MNLGDNKFLIHVVGELVIVGGVSLFFKKKIDGISKEVGELREELKKMATVLTQHHQILAGGRPQAPPPPRQYQPVPRQSHHPYRPPLEHEISPPDEDEEEYVDSRYEEEELDQEISQELNELDEERTGPNTNEGGIEFLSNEEITNLKKKKSNKKEKTRRKKHHE